MPGAPLLLVPRRFTPSIQHLPVATRGSTSVLFRSSWGQSHLSPRGHRRASAGHHAGMVKPVPRVAGGASAYRKALRWFSVQVVHVAGGELRALLEESEASVSPLLCLSQSGPPSFLHPVTVQLPLPPGVTGEAACHRTEDGCLEGEAAYRGFSLLLIPVQVSVWTAPTCTCCTGHPRQPPGTTSPLRWHWNSLTCMHVSRSHTSPGQCPLASSVPPSALHLYGHTSTPALPGTGSGIPPKAVWGAWHGRPGNGCVCTA